MTKIPPDDILEGLYKLRVRESEKLKTVLELYDLENHQKKIGPDYNRLKTMVAREMRSPRHVQNRRRGGTCRGGRMNQHLAVVPSSRRGNTSSESRRRESPSAQKG